MKVSLIILMLLMELTGLAQNQVFKFRNIIDRINDNVEVSPGELIVGIAPPGPVVLGTPYLDTAWLATKVVLTNNKVYQGIVARYNFYSNQLEFKTNTVVKAINAKDFIAFGIVSNNEFQEYVSLHHLGDKQRNGIGRLIYESEDWIFLDHVSVNVKKPNYSPQFDMGERNYKIVKENELIAFKGNEFFKLKPTAKALGTLLNVNPVEISKFIKDRDLSLKDRNHLKLVLKEFIE